MFSVHLFNTRLNVLSGITFSNDLDSQSCSCQGFSPGARLPSIIFSLQFTSRVDRTLDLGHSPSPDCVSVIFA